MNRPIQDNSWLLWQLADSAFPTGGFAHSGGLEAAWQSGEIGESAELSSFLEAALLQTASSMIPFVAAACNAPDDLPALDRDCDAFLCNHVANRASRLQGRAVAASIERIFATGKKVTTTFFHLAPVFGATMNTLGLPASAAVELFLFQSLRGWMSAAVRLGIVGPMQAQGLQFRLAPVAREILQSRAGASRNEIANTAPILEICQGGHDRLYSRLFQS